MVSHSLLTQRVHTHARVAGRNSPLPLTHMQHSKSSHGPRTAVTLEVKVSLAKPPAGPDGVQNCSFGVISPTNVAA